jgi:CRISPR-associated protein Csb2
MMLAIEVEYLTGVAFATGDGGPDWPPQPDRLFSALVASWGARGRQPRERLALEWLETQPVPRIACSGAARRTPVEVYVPPNDLRGLGGVPQFRKNRQPRHFPAAIPHVPRVRFLWPDEPEADTLDALDALARDTSYLGHSASLVRCRVMAVEQPADDTQEARRRIYPGRLDELDDRFHAGRRPLLEHGGAPPAAARPAEVPAAVPASVFGADWIVLADDGGTVPDPVAAAVAAKTLLQAVLTGYGDGKAPPWVTGHAADGSPLAAPHLAAVPLLDAGWRWSQGRLMGMALVLPRDIEVGRRRRDPDALEKEEGLFHALGRVRTADAQGVTLALRLPGGLEWRLRREAAPEKASLRPARYCRPSRLWASVTPIALDRHPKAKGDAESSIMDACERIGLPRPVQVVAAKHSALTGTHPARPRPGAPDWTRWRLPGALNGRRLTHAVIRFADRIAGPVMLGAGRFAGLGLCLAIDEEDMA